tara:strand:- start:546 stop:818 length:273 start_codon:yes stop_codon:yes gene_type:complete
MSYKLEGEEKEQYFEKRKQEKLEYVEGWLRKAQNSVVGTELDDLYFDFCYYHITGLSTELDTEDLETIEKSAKAIIKMAKLEKEITSILY